MKFLKIAFVLIAPAILIGAGCPGNGTTTDNTNQNQTNTTTTTTDPLADAQKAFKEKIFQPFFLNRRCSICHDFVNQRAGIFATHPDKSSNCASCHTALLVGFGPPAWAPAPDADIWNASSDPNDVRAHIITLGPALYNHLLGEGANKTPQVQWAFYNGPDTTLFGGPINAGKVPTGGAGQEHPSGQIANIDLLDWTAFKFAVRDWMCLEAKIPGSTDLGLPPTVTCP